MRFYFCTAKDGLGETIFLSPRVPETIDPENEDNTIKRICVSSSILGCLSGIGHTLDKGDKVCIYYCDINDMNIIHQPSKEEVSDADYTGEFWILKRQKFTFLKSIIIDTRKHFYIENCKLYAISFKDL